MFPTYTALDNVTISVLDDETSAQDGPQMPSVFSLGQNYPNPFNPTTTIAYSIPGNMEKGVGSTETKLVVYDILGREVAVLVNQKKAPGSYEVKFNASALASGVYLYRLTAESFVQTRKMIVVK